jgi:hypothetical protein
VSSENQRPLRIKLNQFQRMMLRWNALHPYNAVHVVRLDGTPDLDRLKSTIASTLQSVSFEEIVLHPAADPSSSKCFEPRNLFDRSPDISILPSSDASVLQSHVERELNRAFVCGPRVNPFRFFVQTIDQSFWLGLTYFHPVADAEAIVWLLLACVDAYSRPVQLPPPALSHPSPRHPATQARPLETFLNDAPGPLLLRHPFVALRRLGGIATNAAALRRCFRPPMRDHNDFTNGFVFFSVPAQGLRALIAAAKSWNVTVNDLFLALLLKSVSPLASRRHTSGKRRRLAIGCIVNVRKDLGLSSRPLFGLFLGSFILTHEASDTLPLEALARDINRETTKIKKRRLALGTPVELFFGRLLFSLFSTERQKKLYQKNYPLWGGITNMNLNAIWPAQNDSPSFDYFRAVSTGPATPLVFSLTTAGDHLNAGLTFRTTVFSKADIAQVQTMFLKHINELEPA